MRTLAVDLGARRVGLALSDAGGKLATPLDVLHVTEAGQALEGVCELIRREGAERVVIGLPLNMDGTAGPQAERAIEWGRKLQQRCGIAVLLVDERLSSFEAGQRLVDRKRLGEKITRARKKRVLDAHAAAAFLQDFLDGTVKAHQRLDPP